MIRIEFEEENKKSVAYDDNIYIENEGCWNIVHTEVSTLYQGQGIARRLVEKIIENAIIQNRGVIAECSYAKKIIENIEKNS